MFFSRQAPLISARMVAAYKKKLGTQTFIVVPGVVKADPTDIDWKDLIDLVASGLEHGYVDGAEDSARDLGVSPFGHLNVAGHAYAKDRGAELVGMKFDAKGKLVQNPNARWAITDTTRDDLRDLEVTAFEEGWTPDQLAAAINDLIDDPARAQMIAETEMAFAQQAGSLAEWTESGVVSGKEWLLSNDHPEEDECDDNAEAGVIDLEDDFPSGDDTAPAHPHCHCDVVAIVDPTAVEEMTRGALSGE